jgi:hypothetical protein
MFGDYDTVRKGLDWFRQHFAKAIHGSVRLDHHGPGVKPLASSFNRGTNTNPKFAIFYIINYT